MTKTNKEALLRLMDKCDIYFENSLISKERIIRKYAEFLFESIGGQGHSISIAQHTGSIGFDVVAFFIAALGCLALNETDNEEVLQSFEYGDYVLLNGKERCIWRGFTSERRNTKGDFEATDYGNATFARLDQPTSNMRMYIPRSRWNGISPYKGTSTRTDGRGIKKQKNNRNNFISYLFDIPVNTIPSVIGVSTVIVTDRDAFKRIADGMHVEYGDGQSIGLLDLVTASYYTSDLKEYQYGANPGKTEPILKVVSKVSVARDLVLDKNGNKIIGFMVVGTDTIANSDSELINLLERKSLNFAVLTSSVDSDVTQEVIKMQEKASIFVCTKEFLLQNSEPPKNINFITAELESQTENILNNDVSAVLVDGFAVWEDIKTLKSTLYSIRQSNLQSEEKDDFIVKAYALINIIMTAIFPLERLNAAFYEIEFSLRATSPASKLRELCKHADNQTESANLFLTVTKIINRLYHGVLENCPKYDALLDLLRQYVDKEIAIIVPKAYYINVLIDDDNINTPNVTIITANRFREYNQYDLIIVAGDFSGTHFDPFRCRSAPDIFVILYEGESKFFLHKKREAEKYERSINIRLGLSVKVEDEPESVDETASEEISSVINAVIDLENYIDITTTFDINTFVRKFSDYSENTPMAEVYAIGHFTNGERAFFTRYYQAVVFDGISVMEKETKVIVNGDRIVFAKRDDNTKNMVDYIYEQLRLTGRLSRRILSATKKAEHWKLALREYKKNHNLSYRDLTKRLNGLGLSIQEVTVRQWLIDDSRIVGPREENTLLQIANLTQDPFLLADIHTYFISCEVVRRQRKKILKLIGKAIVDKLSGIIPTGDKLLEFIFENVDMLSDTLELDDFIILDKPVLLPASLTNRPVDDQEVIL